MNTQALDKILENVSELKVFFDFGERTVPLLAEIAAFTQEIAPVIQGIKSLVDVTSQKLPKASEQLGRVNQFADRASTDILNTVDKMVATIDSLQSESSGRTGAEGVYQTAQKVGTMVDALAKSRGNDEAVLQLLQVWDLHCQSLKNLNPIDGAVAKLEALREDCTNIMMALQVTDITGQQIAAVIGLMQAVDDVLRRLLSEFSDVIQIAIPGPQAAAAAQEVGVDERKKMVESLLQKARTGNISLDTTST
jgi:chemotaxis regulatin CheY-phosphate phosphatase CheZ